MTHGVWAKGYEALIRGRGGMQWWLWGWWRVAKLEGYSVCDRAGSVRWLSECMACPDILCVDKYIAWEEIDQRAFFLFLSVSMFFIV